MRKRTFVSSALVPILSGLAPAAPSWGQERFPSKPVHLIAMGAGFPDATARAMGAIFSEIAGVPVVVETKPGANGMLAAQYVAKTPADGYTVLVGSNSTHAANQSLYKNVPYDYVADFAPISALTKGSLFVFAHPSVPENSIAELTEYARKNPDKLTYGSGSSVTQVSFELYKMLTGVKIRYVPYKTNPQSVIDILSGRIDLIVGSAETGMQHVKAGKLKVLATTGSRRSELAPEVPTMQEAGVRGYEMSYWLAAYAPAGTPKEIVAKLNEYVTKALADPRFKQYVRKAGVEAFPTSPDALMKFQVAEHDKWRKIIVAADIKADGN